MRDLMLQVPTTPSARNAEEEEEDNETNDDVTSSRYEAQGIWSFETAMGKQPATADMQRVQCWLRDLTLDPPSITSSPTVQLDKHDPPSHHPNDPSFRTSPMIEEHMDTPPTQAHILSDVGDGGDGLTESSVVTAGDVNTTATQITLEHLYSDAQRLEALKRQNEMDRKSLDDWLVDQMSPAYSDQPVTDTLPGTSQLSTCPTDFKHTFEEKTKSLSRNLKSYNDRLTITRRIINQLEMNGIPMDQDPEVYLQHLIKHRGKHAPPVTSPSPRHHHPPVSATREPRISSTLPVRPTETPHRTGPAPPTELRRYAKTLPNDYTISQSTPLQRRPLDLDLPTPVTIVPTEPIGHHHPQGSFSEMQPSQTTTTSTRYGSSSDAPFRPNPTAFSALNYGEELMPLDPTARLHTPRQDDGVFHGNNEKRIGGGSGSGVLSTVRHGLENIGRSFRRPRSASEEDIHLNGRRNDVSSVGNPPTPDSKPSKSNHGRSWYRWPPSSLTSRIRKRSTLPPNDASGALLNVPEHCVGGSLSDMNGLRSRQSHSGSLSSTTNGLLLPCGLGQYFTPVGGATYLEQHRSTGGATTGRSMSVFTEFVAGQDDASTEEDNGAAAHLHGVAEVVPARTTTTSAPSTSHSAPSGGVTGDQSDHYLSKVLKLLSLQLTHNLDEAAGVTTGGRGSSGSSSVLGPTSKHERRSHDPRGTQQTISPISTTAGIGGGHSAPHLSTSYLANASSLVHIPVGNVALALTELHHMWTEQLASLTARHMELVDSLRGELDRVRGEQVQLRESAEKSKAELKLIQCNAQTYEELHKQKLYDATTRIEKLDATAEKRQEAMQVHLIKLTADFRDSLTDMQYQLLTKTRDLYDNITTISNKVSIMEKPSDSQLTLGGPNATEWSRLRRKVLHYLTDFCVSVFALLTMLLQLVIRFLNLGALVTENRTLAIGFSAILFIGFILVYASEPLLSSLYGAPVANLSQIPSTGIRWRDAFITLLSIFR